MKKVALTALGRSWLIGLIVTIGIVLFVVARGPRAAPPAVPVAAAPAAPSAASPPVPAEMASAKATLPASGLRYHVDTMAFAQKQAVFSGSKPPAAVVPVGMVVTISGWAVDNDHNAPGSGIVLLVDGKTRLIGQIGGPRPDVAAAMGQPALTNSGFAVTIPGTMLRRGRHTASLLVLDATRKAFYRTSDVIQLDVR